MFQYATFKNGIPLSSPDAYELFPNTVAIGANPNTPQKTEQTKWQFRDDFSWTITGMGGLGHDFKAGVNFINEPHLFTTFNSGIDDYFYTHLTDERTGPMQTITRNGGIGDVNIPFKQYSTYVQDDWRVNDRLTLNLGLRYDVVKGVQVDQSSNPNFQALQAAGQAGRFQGVQGMDTFGEEPQDDLDNIQPRAGFAYDVQRERPECRSAAAGASIRTSATPTRTSSSRRSTRAASGTARSSRSTTPPASGRRTARSSASAIRSRPSRARTRRTRTRYRSSDRSPRRRWSSHTRGRPTSAGRTS